MSKAFVQRPAPAFEATVVHDGSFEKLKLSDLLGKWVVLLFYPLDFTFVCPTEILAFNSELQTFQALNTEVLAVSTDSEYCHLAWMNTKRGEGGLGKLDLKLVADKSMSISRSYGVLLEESGVALRGLFIIDPQGILRQITINDLAVGRSVHETLRLLKAYQFTDEHGEVCPANWDPDAKGRTIKPDPKGALEYFAAAAAGDESASAKKSPLQAQRARPHSAIKPPRTLPSTIRARRHSSPGRAPRTLPVAGTPVQAGVRVVSFATKNVDSTSTDYPDSSADDRAIPSSERSRENSSSSGFTAASDASASVNFVNFQYCENGAPLGYHQGHLPSPQFMNGLSHPFLNNQFVPSFPAMTPFGVVYPQQPPLQPMMPLPYPATILDYAPQVYFDPRTGLPYFHSQFSSPLVDQVAPEFANYGPYPPAEDFNFNYATPFSYPSNHYPVLPGGINAAAHLSYLTQIYSQHYDREALLGHGDIVNDTPNDFASFNPLYLSQAAEYQFAPEGVAYPTEAGFQLVQQNLLAEQHAANAEIESLEMRNAQIQSFMDTGFGGTPGRDTGLDLHPSKFSRRTGVTKFFDKQKGYGFIVDDLVEELGGRDGEFNFLFSIFVHFTAIELGQAFRCLAQGEKVEYDIVIAKSEGYQAIKVCGVDGMSLQGLPDSHSLNATYSTATTSPTRSSVPMDEETQVIPMDKRGWRARGPATGPNSTPCNPGVSGNSNWGPVAGGRNGRSLRSRINMEERIGQIRLGTNPEDQITSNSSCPSSTPSSATSTFTFANRRLDRRA